MTLDSVVGSLPARQIAREQPVECEFLCIGQASRDALEEPGLCAGVELFGQPVPNTVPALHSGTHVA